MNHKKVQRLWRDEGLKVPYRKKKKKRLTGVGVVVGAMRPIAPNVIWAMDFQFDQTSDLRTVKLLNIIDEFTRGCLTIDVGQNLFLGSDQGGRWGTRTLDLSRVKAAL